VQRKASSRQRTKCKLLQTASATKQNGFQVDGVSVNSLDWGGAATITPNEES